MTDKGRPVGPQSVRVLVLGGYGHFGTRVCRALANEPSIQLVIAGRCLDRANELCRRLGTNPERHEAARVDHGAVDFGATLASLCVDVVIHTGGPYQGQNYHVAEACIVASIHYVDLADGREFVANITRLDRAARDAGVLAVSGASTLPAVSSCVVDHYLPDFKTLTAVRVSITPGQRTPRGVATLEAVLSYCGWPFVQLEHGKGRTVYGWQELQRFHYPDLGTRWLGVCDVPDLSLFPQRYPDLQTVQFHAGLELSVMQWSMWGLAWLVRLGVVKQLSRYARALKRIGDQFQSIRFLFGAGRVVGGSGRSANQLLAAGRKSNRF